MIPPTPNLSVILWCARMQIAQQRCDCIEHALEHVLEHTHMHARTQGGVLLNIWGEHLRPHFPSHSVASAPVLISHPLLLWALHAGRAPYPSLPAGPFCPSAGTEGLSCPFPMHGFPFWAVMDCGSEGGLLCAYYHGVWTFMLQDSPSPTCGRGLSLKHHYPPCPPPSPVQVYGILWDRSGICKRERSSQWGDRHQGQGLPHLCGFCLQL